MLDTGSPPGRIRMEASQRQIEHINDQTHNNRLDDSKPSTDPLGKQIKPSKTKSKEREKNRSGVDRLPA
jgi:hypothetical protein